MHRQVCSFHSVTCDFWEILITLWVLALYVVPSKVKTVQVYEFHLFDLVWLSGYPHWILHWQVQSRICCCCLSRVRNSLVFTLSWLLTDNDNWIFVLILVLLRLRDWLLFFCLILMFVSGSTRLLRLLNIGKHYEHQMLWRSLASIYPSQTSLHISIFLYFWLSVWSRHENSLDWWQSSDMII